MRDGDVDLVKVLGTEIPADVLTKFTDKQTLERLMPIASLDWEDGRPASAPSLTNAVLPLCNIGHGLYLAQERTSMPSVYSVSLALSSLSTSIKDMMGSMVTLANSTAT